ncbi:hypothetical protein MJH12_07180, partial [bacterium]|nr:hypothetical protein [bacterium]
MKYIFSCLFIVSTALVLSGCGGGGVSDNNTPINKQNPAPVATILSGLASKGPVRNGTVNAYAVINGQKAHLLTSTTTDLNG